MARNVLVIDDDVRLARLLRRTLAEAGMQCDTVASGEEGLRAMLGEPPSCAVLDLGLPDIDGREVLKRLRDALSDVPVVVLTAHGGVEQAVQCMQLGAVDFVEKPFDPARVVTSVKNAVERGRLEREVVHLKRELRHSRGFSAILGESAQMKQAVRMLRRAAASDVTLLLTGESGTGKEIAARAVHAEGERAGAPFVAVNCGAIPEGLIESELFGHEKGAFTGASRRRPGRFVEADGGTVFLDEIGELRTDLQVRLLRVLQERSVQPVGADRPRRIDVRVIAATNRDLRAETRAGRFREDLYYRLSVFPVELPPLRDRQGDVAYLAEAFVRRFAKRHGRKLDGISPAAMEALGRYSWPGNVRELENVLERAVILEDGEAISLGSLPAEIAGATAAPPERPVDRDEAVIRPLMHEEERLIRRALEITGWNLQQAAQRLGIGRATIYRKMERFGIRRGER